MENVSDERRLNQWIADLGIEGHRRIVRTTPTSLLVSKFENGFAHRLIARLDQLAALFDQTFMRDAYVAVSLSHPELTRAAAWHRAGIHVLAGLARQQALEPREVAEIEAGIDSVAAMLDAVLFMGASAREPQSATAAEAVAYQEALARMDDESSLFTRTYGLFDGRLVVNHCPGSRFARELFQQAWSICSGTD